MSHRKSQPSFPEANRLLEEHELARRLDSERTRTDGAFAGIARQHDADRRADELRHRDQDVAFVVIARAVGVEDQLPEAIRDRGTKAAPPAPPAKPKPARVGIGKDTNATRVYALLGFGTALVQLALEILRRLDNEGLRR